MTQLSLPPYQTDKTTIEAQEGSNGTLVVTFRGSIDHANPGEFLDPFLEQVHSHVLQKRLPQVEANFTELSFLNSSGIKSLIKWVMKQMELSEGMHYAIKFIYSSKVTWQQTSLKAITYLAKGSVVAEGR